MSTPRWITAAEVTQEEAGDVQGPDSAVDGNIALFDGTTGKLLKAAGVVEGVATIDATTNVLVGDGAGNAVDSGEAIGDLGSLMAVNTARVDAAGSDETGTVGNLSNPFLTVQAAIDAILALESFDSNVIYVIDIGINNFSENLVINDQIILLFKGSTGVSGDDLNTPCPWQSLTFTVAAQLFIQDCSLDNSGITTSDDLDVTVGNVNFGGSSITSTAASGKHLSVISPMNSAFNFGSIQADDISEINVIGVTPYLAGSIQCANSAVSVRVKNCGRSPRNTNDNDPFNIICEASGGASVTVVNSTVKDISVDPSNGYVTLINSTATGTITAFSASIDSSGIGVGISFPEADPLIAGAPYWDGATLKKSAGP